MDRSRTIWLLKKDYQKDSIGNFQEILTKRKVYCDVRSITRAEWYDAGRQGFKPDFMVTMFAPDYRGEDELELDGKKYEIYRTYIAQNESIELYCQEIGGIVQNG